ncbi:MAG: C40 family peptidase [Candidatus Nanopelagicales bacterium]
MAIFTRARAVVLAGATAVAVMTPVGAVTTASAAPVTTTAAVGATATTAAATASVRAEERKQRTSRGSRSFAVRAKKVVSRGKSLRGVRYRRGGTTPRGFDCSGFTSYVYRKAGVKLPRTSAAQARHAHRISRSKARRGDLVFYRTSGGRVYHVGIYMGHNKLLHSPRPGKRVGIDRISTKRVTFGRVL